MHVIRTRDVNKRDGFNEHKWVIWGQPIIIIIGFFLFFFFFRKCIFIYIMLYYDCSTYVYLYTHTITTIEPILFRTVYTYYNAYIDTSFLYCIIIPGSTPRIGGPGNITTRESRQFLRERRRRVVLALHARGKIIRTESSDPCTRCRLQRRLL